MTDQEKYHLKNKDVLSVYIKKILDFLIQFLKNSKTIAKLIIIIQLNCLILHVYLVYGILQMVLL